MLERRRRVASRARTSTGIAAAVTVAMLSVGLAEPADGVAATCALKPGYTTVVETGQASVQVKQHRRNRREPGADAGARTVARQCLRAG